MGNSQSTNVAKLVTDVWAKVANESVQNSKITSNNTQIISVSNTGGDVTIKGNVLTQKATLNMKALMDSVSSTESQQKIAEALDQLAKSIVNGFNFLTFTEAKSTVNSLIKSQTEINNVIRQSCGASSTNVQTITVQNTRGSVDILNNTLSQVTEIFDKCALKSVQNNKVIDDIQKRISQYSESKLEGFNLVWVIILAAAIILVPILTAGKVANTAIRFIFPLMILLGAVFIVLYFTLGKTYMQAYYYTQPIRNTGCTVNKDTTIESKTLSAEDAMNVCSNSKTCQMVDVRYTENGTKAKSVPEISYFKDGQGCGLQYYPNKASDLVKADITAKKQRSRYQWLLYIGIALSIGGLFGFIIQRRRGGRSSGAEEIEMSTFSSSS